MVPPAVGRRQDPRRWLGRNACGRQRCPWSGCEGTYTIRKMYIYTLARQARYSRAARWGAALCTIEHVERTSPDSPPTGTTRSGADHCIPDLLPDGSLSVTDGSQLGASHSRYREPGNEHTATMRAGGETNRLDLGVRTISNRCKSVRTAKSSRRPGRGRSRARVFLGAAAAMSSGGGRVKRRRPRRRVLSGARERWAPASVGRRRALSAGV